MTDSYILFLCGGKWQVPWISYLKQKGHKIILVDPNENPKCKKYADLFYRCDVKDIEAIYTFVIENNFKIDLVTSEQTDVSTIPVSVLSSKLNTKAIPLDVVYKFTNKYLSREYVKNIDTRRIPKYKKIKNHIACFPFLEKVQTAIIKPVDAQSSRGITKLNKTDSKRKIENSFKAASSFSNQDYVLIEEFVDGVEFTVEGLSISGVHTVLALSEKKHFRDGIASELNYGVSLSEALQKELISFHNSIVTQTGLHDGITHSEYIVNEKTSEFWLVEMACRGGGTLIPSSIIPWVTGVNVYDMYYNQLFSKEVTALQIDENRNAILHFFEFSPGKVKSIKGIEKCKNIKEVHALELEFSVNDTIKEASDDRGRQGFVIVFAENEKQSRKVIDELYKQIKIDYYG
jgi:biotin carboxylase